MLDPISAAAVRRAHAALNLIDPSPYEPEYSVAAVVRSLCDDRWGKSKGGREFETHRALVDRFGEPSRANSVRLPPDALATRDMTVAGASGSQFLVATDSGPFVDALRPRSVALSLGAQTFDAGRGNVVLPKGANDVVTVWLGDENSPITEGQPTFGAISSTSKILAALTEVSHQLLAQSNAEELLRGLFQRAAGAALDAAVLAGSGAAGQPTGIANTNGIGAFTGTSLNRAGVTNAQLDVATANAVLTTSTGYTTTPAIANTLANRADTIFTTQPVWLGNLHDGSIVGERAMSTTGMPTASMLYGDWSNVTIVTWGTPMLAVDPVTKFNSGIVAIRLLFLVDVVVTNAGGFTLASTIT